MSRGEVQGNLPPPKTARSNGHHVQRTIEEVKERLAKARVGVRLARAEAVRVTNIVLVWRAGGGEAEGWGKREVGRQRDEVR